MKTLSLIQPWATLIVHGLKQYETRSWSTTHRGLLAIHASKTAPEECYALCQREPFRSALAFLGYSGFSALPRGAVLGHVTVEDCLRTVELDGLSDRERAFGDFRMGRWAWRLAHPAHLAVPLPVKGSRGLWECAAYDTLREGHDR